MNNSRSKQVFIVEPIEKEGSLELVSKRWHRASGSEESKMVDVATAVTIGIRSV
jgi:hypothetical protein